MHTDHRTKALVVDLLRYKQERDPGSKDPGLHGADPGLQRTSASPTLAFVRPFRHLTAREVEHRQRMATFLGSQKSEVRGRGRTSDLRLLTSDL